MHRLPGIVLRRSGPTSGGTERDGEDGADDPDDPADADALPAANEDENGAEAVPEEGALRARAALSAARV